MPWNALHLGADRLRVVERGGDQLVEIDGLDVEGLAHMGAAVAQNLHHLVLVADRIELRLHRLRLRHDLAERQRRRENLDEDHVHAGDGGRHGGEWRAKPIANGDYSDLILTKRLFWGWQRRHSEKREKRTI